MRVRATCLPVLHLVGLFQGESLLLWSLFHLPCRVRPAHSHATWPHLPGWGVGIPDSSFSAHPHSLGLMRVCWRKEEMTAAFCGRIDFALF